MSAFFLGASIALGLLLIPPLIRIVRGPTVFDRLIGVGMMGTKTIVLLLLMGYAVRRADMYVDLSIGYGLALLIGVLVAAKFLESVRARASGKSEEEPAESGRAIVP